MTKLNGANGEQNHRKYNFNVNVSLVQKNVLKVLKITVLKELDSLY